MPNVHIGIPPPQGPHPRAGASPAPDGDRRAVGDSRAGEVAARGDFQGGEPRTEVDLRGRGGQVPHGSICLAHGRAAAAGGDLGDCAGALTHDLGWPCMTRSDRRCLTRSCHSEGSTARSPRRSPRMCRPCARAHSHRLFLTCNRAARGHRTCIALARRRRRDKARRRARPGCRGRRCHRWTPCRRCPACNRRTRRRQRRTRPAPLRTRTSSRSSTHRSSSRRGTCPRDKATHRRRTCTRRRRSGSRSGCRDCRRRIPCTQSRRARTRQGAPVPCLQAEAFASQQPPQHAPPQQAPAQPLGVGAPPPGSWAIGSCLHAFATQASSVHALLSLQLWHTSPSPPQSCGSLRPSRQSLVLGSQHPRHGCSP